MTQGAFPFPSADPVQKRRDDARAHRKRSILDCVYELMSAAPRWWTIPELREALRRFGYSVLDTTISARIRDLRKAPFSCFVSARPRNGNRSLVEYRVGIGEAPQHG